MTASIIQLTSNPRPPLGGGRLFHDPRRNVSNVLKFPTVTVIPITAAPVLADRRSAVEKWWASYFEAFGFVTHSTAPVVRDISGSGAHLCEEAKFSP